MADDVSFAQNFIQFFRDHPPKFAKIVDSTSMTISGRRYSYDDLESLNKLFTADVVLKYDLQSWWKMQPADKVTWIKNFVEGTFRHDVIAQKKAREETKEMMRGNGKSELETPDPSYILAHLQSCRVIGDLRREGGFRFFDTKKDVMTDYDYHAIFYALRCGGLEKEVIDEFMVRALHIREEFAPHDPYRLRKIDDSNSIYKVNRHIAPSWHQVDVMPTMPEEVAMLLDHLFPSDECKDFVLTWIYHSLTSRCGTYLYLCGGQGSGKNTLARLIAALHGLENTSNPKQDSFKGRFNQFLKFKTFVFFDEFNCRGRQDKDILKSIINDRVQIEAKGRDHEDIDIYASYLLANNSLEAIGLDPVDRRFSVPNVNHESIIPVYGRDWMAKWPTLLKDDVFIARFGRWLLDTYKDPKWGNEEPYQKERFEEIVHVTARMGIAEMLAKVLRREQSSYDYYEEKEAFRRVYKNQAYPSILDWIKYFTDVRKNGQPLGIVRGKTFTPSEAFMPKVSQGAL